MESIKKTFRILAGRRHSFELHMARIARKAAKLGVEAPSYKMGAAEFEDRERMNPDGSRTTYVVEIFPTTVTAIVVKIPGWTFVATLEHLDGGENIVRSISEESLPIAYRTVSSKCDHCCVNRKRNDTYLVRCDETKEVKQIGRSCIADYLGHKDPEHLARLAELVSSAIGGEEDEWGWGCGDGEDIASIEGYTPLVMSLVRLHGFVGKKLAMESNRTATSLTAWGLTFPGDYDEKKKKESRDAHAAITNEDRAKSTAAIEWILGLDGEQSDFIHNVRAIVRTGYVKHRMAGYAAALSVAYAKAMDEIRERVARPVSKHVGVIGERSVFTVTICKIVAIDGEWGTSYLYIMTDADGNDMKWFGSNSDLGKEGETVTIKATVKKHDVYKERAQTILTRCAVYTPVKKPKKAKEVQA